jgi:hypothetical protein
MLTDERRAEIERAIGALERARSETTGGVWRADRRDIHTTLMVLDLDDDDCPDVPEDIWIADFDRGEIDSSPTADCRWTVLAHETRPEAMARELLAEIDRLNESLASRSELAATTIAGLEREVASLQMSLKVHIDGERRLRAEVFRLRAERESNERRY